MRYAVLVARKTPPPNHSTGTVSSCGLAKTPILCVYEGEGSRQRADSFFGEVTGKEQDAETGLYYYGARYLDGKTSRWPSADPALGDYVPGAPVNDEARKRNGNLPGMGGVFNTVNFHLYHYAGNNPVKYTDPDGNSSEKYEQISRVEGSGSTISSVQKENLNTRVTMGTHGISKNGPCLAMSYLGIAQSYANKSLNPTQVTKLLQDTSVWDGDNAGPARVVIEKALKELGIDTSTLDINYKKTYDGKVIEGAIGAVRAVGTSVSGTTTGHYQQIDSNGDFVWDPLDGVSNNKRGIGDEVRSIFITPKREEE